MLMASEALTQVQGDAFVCVRHTYPLETHERSGTLSLVARIVRTRTRAPSHFIILARGIASSFSELVIGNKKLHIYAGKYW